MGQDTHKIIQGEDMNVPLEMQQRYIERRKKDLENCILSLQQQDFLMIEKVGHKLKGNGVTFGHSDLSSIGSHLETAALTNNLIELEKAIEEFSQWLGRNIN